jgi:signal transduction histidine kinase
LQQQAIELEAQTDEAQSLAEELEQTNELLQQQAEEAEEARGAAESANRAKTEFLAVMSHELRTPLNAIAGYADLLRMGLRGPVTTEQLEDLDRIMRSERTLLSLINDILNYARIEAGQVHYAAESVPLRALISDLESLVSPQLRAKRLQFSYAKCDDALVARADSDKVRQILVNLISNAIKFTPADGTIEANCVEDNGVVRVHVRDTGVGIPPEKLQAIFEPFVQLDRSLTNVQEGSGLGLSISRDLARAMGGDLTAESTPGYGSTFVLTLPRAL